MPSEDAVEIRVKVWLWSWWRVTVYSVRLDGKNWRGELGFRLWWLKELEFVIDRTPRWVWFKVNLSW